MVPSIANLFPEVKKWLKCPAGRNLGSKVSKMRPVKRIEADDGRIFVRDDKGQYYEEFSHVIGGRFYRRLDIPKPVKQDIVESAKDALIV